MGDKVQRRERVDKGRQTGTGEGDRGMGDRGKRAESLKMHLVRQNDFRLCSATEYKGKKA